MSRFKPVGWLYSVGRSSLREERVLGGGSKNRSRYHLKLPGRGDVFLWEPQLFDLADFLNELCNGEDAPEFACFPLPIRTKGAPEVELNRDQLLDLRDLIDDAYGRIDDRDWNRV